MISILKTILAGVACCFWAATPLITQESSEGGQSLQDAANDPTASLKTFQVQNFYSPDLYDSAADSNVLQFRAAVPFKLGDNNHIFRLTLPYVTDSASGKSGISDVTVFDLVTLDRKWGRFGLGGVALLPTGKTGLSAEKWALGPAAGFVLQRPWGLAGLFNQNLLTVAGDRDRADVNISTFQPILTVPLGQQWSVGLSEMTLVYDWDQNRFTSLPLGVKVSKLARLKEKSV